MMIPTPTDIMRWCKTTTQNHQSGSPVFDGWDRQLWSKPYDDIVEFLIDRFETTLCESEYYLCILYLGKHTPKEALYVPFKQSPQYMRLVHESILGTNTLPKNKRGCTLQTPPKKTQLVAKTFQQKTKYCQ